MNRSLASTRLRLSIILLNPVCSVFSVFLFANASTAPFSFNLSFSEYKIDALPIALFQNATIDSALHLCGNGEAAYGAGAVGRGLYSHPIRLRDSTTNSVLSFNTSFEFSLTSRQGSNEGLAFVMVPDNITTGQGGEYLGWLSSTTNGNRSGHNFAVEFDSFQNLNFNDLNDNHVGVNINSMNSTISQLAGVLSSRALTPLNLTHDFGSKTTLYAWIEYNHHGVLNVTVANFSLSKPPMPLISETVDLTGVLDEFMYVGFSSATRTPDSSDVNSWTFSTGEPVLIVADNPSPSRSPPALPNTPSPSPSTPALPNSPLPHPSPLALPNSPSPSPSTPALPNSPSPSPSTPALANSPSPDPSAPNVISKTVIPVSVSLSLLSLLLVTVAVVFYHRSRKKRDAGRENISQITELDNLPDHYGAHKIRYKDLRDATGKFSENKKLGKGGFGWVYKGVLPGSKIEVAVKRIGKTSKQGTREFMAEVKIIGRMRHRNLVPLLGWCHYKSKGELLLVYEYMPKGSLDHLLFHKTGVSMTTFPAILLWEQRLKILVGVATALQFLHEDYEQCVLHRDVKASNVMLDADFNARLGDFGLARLYDHNQGPQTTKMLAGTLGYMAPELFEDGRATKKTDVYSFGALTLEIATGHHATERHPGGKVLVDWVWNHFSLGNIMDVADSTLGGNYDEKELELVLHMGLLCCHPDPDQRPTMRQSLSYLKMEAPFPIDMLPLQKPLPPFASNYGSNLVDQVFSGTRSITQLQNDASLDSDQRKVEFSSSLTIMTSDQLSGGR